MVLRLGERVGSSEPAGRLLEGGGRGATAGPDSAGLGGVRRPLKEGKRHAEVERFDALLGQRPRQFHGMHSCDLPGPAQSLDTGGVPAGRRAGGAAAGEGNSYRARLQYTPRPEGSGYREEGDRT